MRDRLPLMIFAAGFGTRMGALTADRPKPLIPLAGRSLIDRAIDMGLAAECAPIVANTHYLADDLERVLAARGVAISRETPDILETGGGLRRALPLLGGDIVVTFNPDTAWRGPNPLACLMDHGLGEEAGALLLVAPASRTRGRRGTGDFSLAPDGRLSRGGDMVYLGVQLIRAEPVEARPEAVFSLNLVWDALETEGRLLGLVYPGLWGDVGTPEGLSEAERMLSEDADAG